MDQMSPGGFGSYEEMEREESERQRREQARADAERKERMRERELAARRQNGNARKRGKGDIDGKIIPLFDLRFVQWCLQLCLMRFKGNGNGSLDQM
jgi:hypothetical protein